MFLMIRATQQVVLESGRGSLHGLVEDAVGTVKVCYPPSWRLGIDPAPLLS
jgi:hypothetical protein